MLPPLFVIMFSFVSAVWQPLAIFKIKSSLHTMMEKLKHYNIIILLQLHSPEINSPKQWRFFGMYFQSLYLKWDGPIVWTAIYKIFLAFHPQMFSLKAGAKLLALFHRQGKRQQTGTNSTEVLVLKPRSSHISCSMTYSLGTYSFHSLGMSLHSQ